MMSSSAQSVFIVDDDEAVRQSLALLMKSVGLNCETFASAQEFLQTDLDKIYGCLLLDVRMPGMSGLGLQEELLQRKIKLPIIFMTGHGDIPMAVEAMKKGAVDFLSKPFRDQELIDRINQTLSQSAQVNNASSLADSIRERFSLLTPREREVFEGVVRGEANKLIASNLGISIRTVEVHRKRVMEKMNAKSLAELVQFAMHCDAVK